MYEDKLISVIVPVYKTEKYIRQCVDSILQQTHKRLEVILVDDGSPDKCPQICDEYMSRDNRIIVIHQKNTGLSGARNCALDICKGDYISFVDSDDWIEANTYEIVLNKIAAYNVDAVCFTANIIQGGKNVENRFKIFPNNTIKTADEMVELTLSDQVGGQVWLKVYSKKCWENVKFPEKRLYEDLAISFRPFLSASRGILFIDNPLYNYRLNEEGISLSVNPEKNFHIFLGFKEHYNFALTHNRESEDACLAKAASFAIGYLNGRIRYKVSNHEDSKKIVTEWLEEKKDLILTCSQLDKKRRGMLNLYYFSPPIYQMTYKFFTLIDRDR